MIQATLDEIELVSTDVKTFWFTPQQRVLYTPGQFTEISLPHAHEDDRGHSRWFTLSSSPTEKRLAFTTRFSTKTSSFKKQLSTLKPGAKLQLAEPMGDFVLPKDASLPLVFVAGGMGITPFRSIVKWLQDTGEKRHIDMLVAVKVEEDLLFQPLFTHYGINMVTLVSEPPRQNSGLTGHLNGDMIYKLVDGLMDKRLYISGPEPMVETLESQMKKLGFDPSNLVLDFFPGYRPI